MWLLLLIASWLLELGLGATLCTLYWHFSLIGQANLLDLVAYVLNPYHANITGVTQLLWAVFIGIHLAWIVCGWLAPVARRYSLGVRRPTGEENTALTLAFTQLQQDEPPPRWLIHDSRKGISLQWIGGVLVIDRQMITHPHLPALMACELGYANSETLLVRHLYKLFPPTPWMFGIAFGLPFGLGVALLAPAWAAYFRRSVYQADRYAVECGQGPALLQALKERLPLDQPTVGARWLQQVPYVADRIRGIEALVV